MALAQKTRTKYDRVVGEFFTFRRATELDQVWPIPVEHLQQFIVVLHKKGLAPGTIQGKLAALGFHARAQGLKDNSGDFRIKKMLEGWLRERGRRKDGRTPISPGILEGLAKLWGEICRDDYEIALFHAAAVIAFFGAMRISELVALSKTDVSGRALQWGDVSLQKGRVICCIRRSKTDQLGKGRQVALGTCSVRKICPVRAIGRFMHFRGSEKGYFFRHRDGSPLTKYQFWKLTDMALERLGVKNLRFGTHSFRIGAASTAASMGYGVERIKQLGRWSSGCYSKYIRHLPNV